MSSNGRRSSVSGTDSFGCAFRPKPMYTRSAMTCISSALITPGWLSSTCSKSVVPLRGWLRKRANPPPSGVKSRPAVCHRSHMFGRDLAERFPRGAGDHRRRRADRARRRGQRSSWHASKRRMPRRSGRLCRESTASWYHESAITPGAACLCIDQSAASAIRPLPVRRNAARSWPVCTAHFSNPGCKRRASSAHCRAASRSCSRSCIFASSSKIAGRSRRRWAPAPNTGESKRSPDRTAGSSRTIRPSIFCSCASSGYSDSARLTSFSASAYTEIAAHRPAPRRPAARHCADRGPRPARNTRSLPRNAARPQALGLVDADVRFGAAGPVHPDAISLRSGLVGVGR